MDRKVAMATLALTLTLSLVTTALGLEAVRRGQMPLSMTGLKGFEDRATNSILVFGGAILFEGTPLAFRYDLASEEVAVAGAFPHPIHGGGVAYGWNDTYFYFGGKHPENFENNFLSTIWRIYPEDPNPVPIGDLPAQLAYVGVSDDGEGNIYVTGGQRPDGTESTEILKFSATGLEVVAQLPAPRNGAVTAFANGALYVFGGDLSGEHDIYKYSTGDGVVGVVGRIPAWAYASAVTVGTDIYIVGGRGPMATPFSMRRFDTITETLEVVEVENLTQQVAFSTATYIEHLNSIYIVGGTYDDEYIYSILLE